MRRVTILVAFLLAVAVHGSLFRLERHPGPRRLWGDEQLYVDAAREIAAGRAPELALLWPPLYPRLLSPLLTLERGHLVVEVLQTLLLVVAALALGGLGCRLFSARAGALAAGFLLVYPPLVAYAHYLWPEIVHLALFLVAVWILVARSSGSAGTLARAEVAWLAASGLLLGLALLTKSILGPFLPCLLLPLATSRGVDDSWRCRLARPAIVLAAVLATVTPTLADHWQRYRELSIANSGPFNLAVGLADVSPRNLEGEIVGDAYRSYLAGADTPRGRNERLWTEIRERVERQGSLATLRAQLGRQYFRLLDRRSFLDDMLPGGAIAARGYGYVAAPSWLAAALSGLGHALYGALLLAATAGVASLVRPGPWVRVLLAFLAYNLLLFLGLHVMTRYRIQLEPILALLAAQAVVTAPQLRARLRRRPGFALALATAAILVLGLGFS
jgi:4-amino-4-deoxy-L-arabinose transferase-like glycosyltransferase